MFHVYTTVSSRLLARGHHSGYLTPIFYLPTYTQEKVPGISDFVRLLSVAFRVVVDPLPRLQKAAFTVTALNVAAAMGRTIVGFGADRFGPVNSLLLVTVLSGLSQMLVWTFVTSYGGIVRPCAHCDAEINADAYNSLQIVFAILYGFNCGCFISLTPAVAARVYGPTRLAGLSGMLFVFNLPGELSVLSNLSTRKITSTLPLPGNAAGAPVAGALLKATGHSWRAVAFIMGGLQVLGAFFLLYGVYIYDLSFY